MALSLRTASEHRLAVLLEALEAVGGTFAELDLLTIAADMVEQTNGMVEEDIANGDSENAADTFDGIADCLYETAGEVLETNIHAARAHIQGL